MLNFIIQIVGYVLSVPARLKGMRLGAHSMLGPGYDFLEVRLRGIELGKNVRIGRNAWMEITSVNGVIKIDDGTNIGRNCMLSSSSRIYIGKKCLLSYNVSIIDHDHNTMTLRESPMDSGLAEPHDINIEDNCFIGAHSFILKGVSLGTHCVVGANSVVTKSFPANSVIAGNPAKLLKEIKDS